MRALIATLVCTMLFFSASAHAKDLSGFYKWANDIVVKSERTAGILNGTATIIIRVKNAWDNDDTPNEFRSWLPWYIVCAKYLSDFEEAPKRNIKNFHAFVILADHAVEQNNKTAVLIPVKENVCTDLLDYVEKGIRK